MAGLEPGGNQRSDDRAERGEGRQALDDPRRAGRIDGAEADHADDAVGTPERGERRGVKAGRAHRLAKGTGLRLGLARLHPRSDRGPLDEIARQRLREPLAGLERPGDRPLDGEDPASTLPEPDCPGRIDSRKRHELGAGSCGDRLGRRRRVDPFERGLDGLALAGVALEGTLELTLVGHVAVRLDIARQPAVGVADRRDHGLDLDQAAVLAPVDDRAAPRLPGGGPGPDGREEPRRLETAVDDPGVLPDDLVRLVAVDPAEGRVDVGHVLVHVLHPDRVGGLLDGRDEPRPLRLGDEAQGHVPDVALQAAVGQLGEADLGRQARAVGAPVPALDQEALPGPGRGQALVHVLRAQGIIRGAQAGRGHGQHLGARVAQHPADGRVRLDVASGLVRDEDAVGGLVDEGAIELLALAQPLSRLAALGHVEREHDDALRHRRDVQLVPRGRPIRELERGLESLRLALLHAAAIAREDLALLDARVQLGHRPPEDGGRLEVAVSRSELVDVEVAPVAVDDHRALEHVVEGRVVALLALANRSLGGAPRVALGEGVEGEPDSVGEVLEDGGLVGAERADDACIDAQDSRGHGPALDRERSARAEAVGEEPLAPGGHPRVRRHVDAHDRPSRPRHGAGRAPALGYVPGRHPQPFDVAGRVARDGERLDPPVTVLVGADPGHRERAGANDGATGLGEERRAVPRARHRPSRLDHRVEERTEPRLGRVGQPGDGNGAGAGRAGVSHAAEPSACPLATGISRH